MIDLLTTRQTDPGPQLQKSIEQKNSESVCLFVSLPQDWYVDPSAISLAPDKSGGPKLKSPAWGYGTFAFGNPDKGRTGYMPLNDQELNSGIGFEAGEESAFIIGGAKNDSFSNEQFVSKNDHLKKLKAGS